MATRTDRCRPRRGTPGGWSPPVLVPAAVATFVAMLILWPGRVRLGATRSALPAASEPWAAFSMRFQHCVCWLFPCALPTARRPLENNIPVAGITLAITGPWQKCLG
jgi:hypothetical protein